MPTEAISRRDFLFASAAPLAAGLASSATTSSRPDSALSKKPNIVLFMPDQLRAESVGCYGHPLVKTPNMNRFASEGVRFAHCQCQYPLCTPSRCSMMTGWPPHVRGHRSYQHLLRRDEPNLFRYLKQNGYDVFWFGKNDLLEHDCFEESVTKWGFFADGPEWSGKDNPWPFDDPRYYSFLFKPGGDRRDYPDYKRVQAAIQVLERDHPKPFCLYLPLFFPHAPFTAPPEFYNMYDPARIPPLRPNGSGKPDFYEAIRKSRRLDRLSETDFLKINSVYLGMISFTDSLLGELLEALERTKHAGDTVVIFCSDHGEWGGDYHLVEKWSSAMDDALTQVPLIIRMPGGPKGRVIGGMVELSDVMATCLDLAGIRAEHTHFARSLLPQLRGAPGDLERAAFSEGGYDRVEPQCFENLKLEPTHIYYPKINLQCEHPETISRTTMMRTLDYKLVMRPDGMGEFYDLKKDPRELHNVYRDRTYDRRREEMQTRMLAWYIRTSDVTPYNLQDNRDMPKANFD